jgi:hypothetical protein
VTTQDLDPDTLLTALYCTIDDLYKQHFAKLKPTRPGPAPALSDSEVLTLMVLSQWHPQRSERTFLAYAQRHLRCYFPRLLSQSAFNRRCRDLMGVLCSLISAVRQHAVDLLRLPATTHRVVDALPVPLMCRCRGERNKLFAGFAAVGRGGSDRHWFYGLKLLAEIDSHYFVTGFTSGPANTEERWLAESLFRWRIDTCLPAPTAEQLASLLGPSHRNNGKRLGPSGCVGPCQAAGAPTSDTVLADLNYTGKLWTQHWHHHYGVNLLTNAAYHTLEPTQRSSLTRWLSSLRLAVETVYSNLCARFGIKFPRARTPWGLRTRLAAKILAHNMNLFINHLFRRPALSAFDPFP